MNSENNNDEFNRLFLKACRAHHNGSFKEAQYGFISLLDSFSRAPVLHYNLGLVYFEQGLFSRAVAAFTEASRLDPTDVDTLFNLALSRKKGGDIDGAIVIFNRLLHKQPRSVDILYTLAGSYREIGRYPEAVEIYLKTLEIKPDHGEALNNLAYTYHLMGEYGKAAEYYGKVLEQDPEHEGARHMLTALSGKTSVTAPDGYIADVFDNYSKIYERSLVDELEYSVPDRLRTLLGDSGRWKHFNHGLDLGCGTGLSGASFIDIVSRLDGVDLSGKMLDLAQKKNIYHTLYRENICSLLTRVDDYFDFYIAADVLGYVGELETVFSLLAERARSGAILCCSTEEMEGEIFQLRGTGRFAHSPHYVERIAAAGGWSLLRRRASLLRKERDGWVEGSLWLLQKD